MAPVEIQAILFASCISWFCLSTAIILDVRLQDGDSPTNGRVEINVEGIGWNTICGSSWDINDVTVTCRQLGFTGAQMELVRSEFDSGTAPIYKKTIHCKGNEQNLDDCRMTTQNCYGSSNSAGVVCQGPSYLGCYGDNPQARLFTGTSYVDSTRMTINDCITFCRLRDFAYAGLELGSECYCGDENTDFDLYGLFSDAVCRHTCSGNQLETCGGIAKMAVHRTAILTTTLVPTTTNYSLPRTPSPIEMTSPDLDITLVSTTSAASEVSSTKSLKATQRSLSDGTMMIIVYILGALLFFCLVIIFGCLIWNCRLRSRTTYGVSDDYHTPPHSNQNVNVRPYMTLSERRPDGNGYQSLSVQRKEAQRGAMPEGPYADSLGGEPVYQEPGVYLEPDNRLSVAYKAGDPDADDLFLGGGNEYETLGV
ncbi:scavenger receptor cysteine-rich type 1 protein M130-like [Lytechinus variegatus]|uniref:scavenger receptor cysteine-rich type 1 protein M130-like n=1 Tax=Lytechinus variegatus TaxID=7654 RepID=UPI001BB26C4E|nr:scavenger receptor cysteine-rich type 1 protein M130-like [Lytechinus variegatus]